MTGIAGWIAPARSAAPEGALGAMIGALRHRGTGRLVGYVEHDAARQAVLGVSLHDPAAQISLVLDGTLANARELRARLAGHGFRFAGDSQEEVLLRAYQYWDKDALRQLRGGFAFAIRDARKDRLFIARDRFGEKPLYLHEKGGALYFASEVKALLAAGIPAKVDLASLRECIGQRYVAGPRTLFAGIRKLQPGTYGLWQHGKLHEARYWSVPDGAPCAGGPAGRGVEGFVAALGDAVGLHGTEAILLSGGLDSAMLLAVAAARGAPPKTFSLGLSGERTSELAGAAQAAAHFGAEHHEFVVAPEELLSHLEYLVACRDAPVPRASELVVCRLASEAARHVKSAITGDGCDEVLGGYRRYAAEVMCGSVDAFPVRLLAPRRVNAYAAALLPAPLVRIPAAGSQRPRPASRLRRALYEDQTSWLPDQLLERNDRAGAAAGLEMRMPFLDHCLVEYVSALPDAQRVRGLATKRILREAARRLLPGALAKRSQGSWRLDVGGWLRHELRDFTLGHLRSRASLTRQYYDPTTLDRVLDEHLGGNKNHETLLWTLLNIEIWHRTYTPG